MENDKFSVGTVVRAKHGGPAMTIEAGGYGRWRCVWFDHNAEVQRGDFQETTLETSAPDNWPHPRA